MKNECGIYSDELADKIHFEFNKNEFIDISILKNKRDFLYAINIRMKESGMCFGLSDCSKTHNEQKAFLKLMEIINRSKIIDDNKKKKAINFFEYETQNKQGELFAT